jgi:hypothetical protein
MMAAALTAAKHFASSIGASSIGWPLGDDPF